jgi:hypothetical protein
MRGDHLPQHAKDDIVDAVLYAMEEGCFVPLPKPKRGASMQELIRWGALVNLHRAVAEAHRQSTEAA